MPSELSDEALGGLFRQAWNASVAQAPTQHSKRTDNCPSLPRFAEALRTGWQADEQAHITSCSYCQCTWDSALRIAAEPDEDDVQPGVLTPAVASPRVRRFGMAVSGTLSAAAGAACSSSVSTGVVFELAGGFRVRLVAKPGQPDVTTLHFDGRKPTPDVRVFVDDRQIELLERVDEFGYTSVAKSDVTALLNGQGIIAIEDTDNQDDDHASR